MEYMELAKAGTALAAHGNALEELQGSARDVTRIASESLTPRMVALIKLAVALAIPNREMAAECLRVAKGVASDDDIAEAVFTASKLKSGAATAYGRLVFKFLDPAKPDSENDGRTEIQTDRALMTQFRAGSVEGFGAFQRRAGATPHRALTDKEFELISIATAMVTHCVYCLESHGAAARKAGATDREVADTLHLVITARTAATLLEWKAATEIVSA